MGTVARKGNALRWWRSKSPGLTILLGTAWYGRKTYVYIHTVTELLFLDFFYILRYLRS